MCKGHSMSAPSGSDIVCAAVSSACYLTANTVTDVLQLHPEMAVADGVMSLMIENESPQPAQDILKGFRLHMTELARQYPDYIKVEV